MFILMVATFIAACFANVGAHFANLFCFVAAQAHHLCGGITNSGALHVELNTFRHHFYIFFLCARRSTMIAYGGTTQTCVDAGFVSVIIFHTFLFN
jgi:hypothetical protein